MHHPNKLGHLIFRPSNQRMYKSSAMGDLRAGAAAESSLTAVAVVTEEGVAERTEPVVSEDGSPDISSCTSVTTSPFEVISLLRVIRLCGKRPRVVLTCCRTAEFLRDRLSA